MLYVHPVGWQACLTLRGGSTGGARGEDVEMADTEESSDPFNVSTETANRRWVEACEREEEECERNFVPPAQEYPNGSIPQWAADIISWR